MTNEVKFVLGFFSLCVIFRLGHSLKCYECSSSFDEKCGKTWGYEDGSTKYLTECVGDKVACKKLEYRDHQQGGMIITRSCWNTTDLTHDFDLECRGINSGDVCYCEGTDDKPCNGGQLLHSRTVITLLFIGLSAVVFSKFWRVC